MNANHLNWAILASFSILETWLTSNMGSVLRSMGFNAGVTMLSNRVSEVNQALLETFYIGSGSAGFPRFRFFFLNPVSRKPWAHGIPRPGQSALLPAELPALPDDP